MAATFLPHLLRTLVILVASGLAAQLPAADEPVPATLPPMTVIAPDDPLERSMQLLHILVDTSAPCLGCDAVPVGARGPNLLELLLPTTEPAQPDAAARLAVDIKLIDSPDLEYLQP